MGVNTYTNTVVEIFVSPVKYNPPADCFDMTSDCFDMNCVTELSMFKFSDETRFPCK